MDQPDQETMEVLVIVAMPSVETRASEIAWEQSILDAVSAAVHADKTLNTIAVKPLEYEDCQWVFERGCRCPIRRDRVPGWIVALRHYAVSREAGRQGGEFAVVVGVLGGKGGGEEVGGRSRVITCQGKSVRQPPKG